MRVTNFRTVMPIKLVLQPVAISDRLMDLHKFLEFDTFASSTQFIMQSIFPKRLSFFKPNINSLKLCLNALPYS